MKADVIEVEPGVYSVLLNGVSHEVRTGAEFISVDGELFTYRREDARQWMRASAGSSVGGQASITAPMPGRVVRVLVRAGEDVKAGQGIVVVEAMKMQNELKSSRAARVATVHVNEGDSVNAGAVLAVLD